MKQAIKLAMKAYELGEVPIGCVIVHEGKVIGRGYNRRTTDKSTLSHAYIGCMNPKAGCAGSILTILQEPAFNHQVEVHKGILETECSNMLTTFFKELRIRLNAEKELRHKYRQG